MLIQGLIFKAFRKLNAHIKISWKGCLGVKPIPNKPYLCIWGGARMLGICPHNPCQCHMASSNLFSSCLYFTGHHLLYHYSHITFFAPSLVLIKISWHWKLIHLLSIIAFSTYFGLGGNIRVQAMWVLPYTNM